MSIIELRTQSLKFALEIKNDLQSIDDVILIADKFYQYLSRLQD